MEREFLPQNGSMQTPLDPGVQRMSPELGLSLPLPVPTPSLLYPHARGQASYQPGNFSRKMKLP